MCVCLTYCSLLSMYITAFPCMCMNIIWERERCIERERKVYTQWLIHMYMFWSRMSACVTLLYLLLYMYMCVKRCEYMHEHVIYIQWLIPHVHNICMYLSGALCPCFCCTRCHLSFCSYFVYSPFLLPYRWSPTERFFSNGELSNEENWRVSID